MCDKKPLFIAGCYEVVAVSLPDGETAYRVVNTNTGQESSLQDRQDQAEAIARAGAECRLLGSFF